MLSRAAACCLLLLASSVAAQQPPNGTSISDPGSLPAIPGTGWNALQAYPTAERCVIYDSTAALASAGTVVYRLDDLTTNRSLREKTNAGVEATFSLGAFNATATSTYIRDRAINRSTRSVLVNVTYRMPVQQLLNPRLSDSALAWARNDPPTFRRRCGHEYVSDVTRGVQVAAVVTIEADSTDDMRELNTKIQSNGGSKPSEAHLNNSLRTIVGNRRARIALLSAGGYEMLPTVDSLEAYVRKVPVLARDTMNHAALVLRTASYGQLQVPAGAVNNDAFAFRQFLRQLEPQMDRLHQLRSEIVDMARPTMGPVYADSVLGALQDAVAAGIETIEEAITRCAQGDACVAPPPRAGVLSARLGAVRIAGPEAIISYQLRWIDTQQQCWIGEVRRDNLGNYSIYPKNYDGSSPNPTSAAQWPFLAPDGQVRKWQVVPTVGRFQFVVADAAGTETTSNTLEFHDHSGGRAAASIHDVHDGKVVFRIRPLPGKRVTGMCR